MQNQPSIFKKGLSSKIILPLLILSIFPHLTLLSVFNMNSTFTASFLDVEVDDIQFLFSMAYALMVCTLLFHVRLFQFFSIRSYLLLMTLLNILVLIAMSLTNNAQVVLVLRFFQGPLTLLEGVILLPILMGEIKGKNSKLIAFSILYGYMLTGDKFATSLVKFAIDNYSHTMILYTLIILHLIVLVIYLLLFNENRMFPKKPLYQMNSSGIVMLMICLVSGSYALIYGKKLYWFESPLICWAFTFCFIFGGFFIINQLKSKRKLFHYEVFLSKRVVIGIGLFFGFYMMRAGMSNIYQIMNTVWQWHWEYVLKIQYFNVAGSIIGIVIAYILMNKNVSFKTIFSLGFLLITVAMYWFRSVFYPDVQLINIAPPLFLEGLAQGILFTPLVLFMLGSVHPSISGSVSMAGTGIRFWSTTIGFAIMQNAMLYLTTKYQTLSLGNLSQTNPMYQETWNALFYKFSKSYTYNDAVSLTVSTLKNKVNQHAILASNIQIFTILTLLGGVITFIILSYSLFKYLKNSKIKT